MKMSTISTSCLTMPMTNTILLGPRKMMTKTETMGNKMLTMAMQKILISTIIKVYMRKRTMDRNTNARRLAHTLSPRTCASGYTKSSTNGSHLNLTFMGKGCWLMELELHLLQTPHMPLLQHQIRICITVIPIARALKASRCKFLYMVCLK